MINREVTLKSIYHDENQAKLRHIMEETQYFLTLFCKDWKCLKSVKKNFIFRVIKFCYETFLNALFYKDF